MMKKYTVTVQRGTNLNPRIVKGMEVEIVSNFENPLNDIAAKQAMVNAFKNKYGVDMTESQIINTTRIEKV